MQDRQKLRPIPGHVCFYPGSNCADPGPTPKSAAFRSQVGPNLADLAEFWPRPANSGGRIRPLIDPISRSKLGQLRAKDISRNWGRRRPRPSLGQARPIWTTRGPERVIKPIAHITLAYTMCVAATHNSAWREKRDASPAALPHAPANLARGSAGERCYQRKALYKLTMTMSSSNFRPKM